ncbi:MAG TPA: oxidoreductase [Pseudonocardiaceae bacterium]|jgi:hemoglobin
MTESMYSRIGGEPVLRELCEKFHALVVADELLAELFADSGAGHVEHLTMFFVEMFGGPARYSTEQGGIGGLYDAHLGKAITEEQRARFVTLLLDAAEDVALPKDAAFRETFARHIEAGSRFSAKFSQPEVLATPRPRFPAIEPWHW